MSTTRLTTSLPTDVWLRLQAEAAAKGVSIGKYTANLIVARDQRKRQADTRLFPETEQTREG